MTHAQEVTLKMGEQSFSGIHAFEHEKVAESRIKNEIVRRDKTFILGVDEIAFRQDIVNRYSMTEVTIDMEHPVINPPVKGVQKVIGRSRDEMYEVETYNIRVDYSFSGSAEIFGIRPATYRMVSEQIDVNPSSVSITVRLRQQDPELFRRELDSATKRAFSNLL